MAFVKTLNWKLREHRQLRQMDVKHSLVRDALSRNYRAASFSRWNDIPKEIASEMGCVFSQRTPGHALREIFIERIYDMRGFVPHKGDTVVDVGASYGDSAIYWSRVCGAHVIAFEPLAGAFNILQENVRLNNTDVHAFNIALGDGNPINSAESGGMLFVCGNGAPVATRRLDDFAIDRADILKIDVEGFEVAVLRGSAETIRKLRPRVIIETHSSELRHETEKIMSELGYGLAAVGRTIRNRSAMDEITNLFFLPS